MEQHPMEPVNLERIRRDAACIITRVGLGIYELQGPAENILVPESRVAWATVVHDLEAEGYRLVTPDEFAVDTAVTLDEVAGRINRDGTLFSIRYGGSEVVALPEKEVVFPDLDVPGAPWAPSGVRLPETDAVDEPVQ